MPGAKFCVQCGKQVVEALEAIASPVAPMLPALPAASTPPPVAHPPAPEPVPALETPTAPPVLPDTKIDPQGQAAQRASSIKDAMKNSSAAETASLGCVIAGLGTLIFVPAPIGVRVGVFLFYLAVAFGIWKMSRIAAIIGLVLACANVLMAVLVAFENPSGVITARVAPVAIFSGIWIKWLYRAVKSTFAYHRSRSATP